MYCRNRIKAMVYCLVSVFFCGGLIGSELFAEGFLSGTQIKTSTGYVAIECIHVNDLVICCDDEWSFTERAVTALHQKKAERYIKIIVGNHVICAAPDQKFYLPEKEMWGEAQSILPGDMLLSNCATLLVVDDVIAVDGEEILYTLTVEDFHNFCVSASDIHVHNVIPVITAVGVATGLGVIEVAKATAAVVGTAIAFLISRNNDKQRSKVGANFGGPSNCDGPSEDDPENENKKRKLNSVSKKEFFESIKKDYERYREGIYRKRRGAKGIENAEYLEWDHLHNDVEAYSKGKRHLGSIDPMTKKLYKNAVIGRKLSF